MPCVSCVPESRSKASCRRSQQSRRQARFRCRCHSQVAANYLDCPTTSATISARSRTSPRQPGSSAVLLVVSAGSVALPDQSRGSEFSFDWRLTPACHARTQTLHGRCEACCGLASRRCRLYLFWLFCLTIASLLTFGHCLLLLSSNRGCPIPLRHHAATLIQI
jgi:hypothetical protein